MWFLTDFFYHTFRSIFLVSDSKLKLFILARSLFVNIDYPTWVWSDCTRYLVWTRSSSVWYWVVVKRLLAIMLKAVSYNRLDTKFSWSIIQYEVATAWISVQIECIKTKPIDYSVHILRHLKETRYAELLCVREEIN